MNIPLIDRCDLDFLLYEWLHMETLADPQTIGAMLDLAEKLAASAFLPHYKQADREEPRLTEDGVRLCPAVAEALAQYAEAGLFAAGFPEEHGGLGLPYLACAASYACFASANLATAAYALLTVANARLILTFGTVSQVRQFALPQIAGRWFGTMCLSEPQAGSSLADVRTRAVPDGDNSLGRRFRLTGNKTWISAGDHDASENIIHLVLAKISGGNGQLRDGTGSLSLFIVPICCQMARGMTSRSPASTTRWVVAARQTAC